MSSRRILERRLTTVTHRFAGPMSKARGGRLATREVRASEPTPAERKAMRKARRQARRRTERAIAEWRLGPRASRR